MAIMSLFAFALVPGLEILQASPAFVGVWSIACLLRTTKFLLHERSTYLPVGRQHSQWGVICPAVSDWSEVLQAGVWALLQSGKQHYCTTP